MTELEFADVKEVNVPSSDSVIIGEAAHTDGDKQPSSASSTTPAPPAKKPTPPKVEHTVGGHGSAVHKVVPQACDLFDGKWVFQDKRDEPTVWARLNTLMSCMSFLARL